MNNTSELMGTIIGAGVTLKMMDMVLDKKKTKKKKLKKVI
jgi:hypothetical protein